MPPDVKELLAKVKAGELKTLTDEQLNEVAAYTEKLSGKLGEQGNEIGQLKKTAEQATVMQQQIQQLSAALNQAAPIYNAAAQNPQGFYRFVGQNYKEPVEQPAAQHVASSLSNLLSPEEQKELTASIIQEVRKQAIEPLQQEWQNSATQYQNNVLQQTRHMQDASNNVLWQLMERMAPEKAEQVRAFRDKAAQFTDPSKLNPMETADQFMQLEMTKTDLESKLKELTEENERLQKASMPDMSVSSTSFFDRESPNGEESSLYEKVLNDVTKTTSPEDLRDFFKADSI